LRLLTAGRPGIAARDLRELAGLEGLKVDGRLVTVTVPSVERLAQVPSQAGGGWRGSPVQC
jgi:hypothetical protein